MARTEGRSSSIGLGVGFGWILLSDYFGIFTAPQDKAGERFIKAAQRSLLNGTGHESLFDFP